MTWHRIVARGKLRGAEVQQFPGVVFRRGEEAEWMMFSEARHFFGFWNPWILRISGPFGPWSHGAEITWLDPSWLVWIESFWDGLESAALWVFVTMVCDHWGRSSITQSRVGSVGKPKSRILQEIFPPDLQTWDLRYLEKCIPPKKDSDKFTSTTFFPLFQYNVRPPQ